MANFASLLPWPGIDYVPNGHIFSFVPLPFNGSFTQTAKYLDSVVRSQPVKDTLPVLKIIWDKSYKVGEQYLCYADTSKCQIHLKEVISP